MSRRIPQLRTDRLIIRELRMEDLESIHRVLNKAFGIESALVERGRWLKWTVLGYEMFEMLGQPAYGERAIELAETGELIGAVGIVPYLDRFNRVTAFGRGVDEPATAEVGLFWAISPRHQRRGYATEAAGAMVNYLFSREQLGRVIATTGYDNVGSQAVMRRLGMQVEHLIEAQPPDQFVVGVLNRHRRL